MAEEMREWVQEKVADGTIAEMAQRHGLLQPTREQKRALLRAIGARVVMYPSKSDYAKEHDGQR